MIAGAIGMGAYFWTKSQIHTFGDHPPPPPVASGSATPAADILGRCAEQACNYLLLGSDSRQGLTKEEQVHFGTNQDIGGENRSDTIILVHTRPGQKQATFVSFPRDLWVDIPGVGTDKINAAFEGGVNHGGPELVARTVKELTGMQIHHVMYVSLAGFQGLVDALGGVDMCVPYPMQDELTGLDIPAGCQHFDGDTALAYVRTRHQPCDAVPDFARISRQQQFLRAVIAKLLAPSELVHLPSLVPALLENLVVDRGLNPAELAYLAGTLQGVGTDAADFRSVPSLPAGIYTSTGTYLSIVKEVQPQADQLFRRIRNDEPLGDLGLELPGVAPSPANIVVSVVNRNAGSVAADTFDVLTEGGFNTSPGILTDADIPPPTKGSLILYRQGQEAMAKVVGSYFPDLDLVPAPARTLPKGQDVAVIVTARYQRPEPSTSQPVDCSANG
jgi:LCP family protein required for cell wall assembly